MKTRLVVPLVGLAISFALPTFAQPTNKPDPQLRQKFVALFKNLDEAFNNSDADAMAVDFTDDAVLVTTYGSFFGRQAIRDWYAELFKEVHASNFLSNIDPDSPYSIGTDHDEMWATGNWRTTLQGEGGSLETKGYWSAIGSREDDHWKIRMLCSNSIPESAATPSPAASPSNQ